MSFVLAALLVLSAPSGVSAQADCDLRESRFARGLELGGGNRITYISGPLLIACRDGTRIRADSAQMHSATSFTQLFGNVFFDDPDKRLRSRNAHYFEREGRLVAWGAVELTDKVNDSVLRGDSLRYLRAGALRPEDHLTVSGGRSFGTLYPGSSSAPSPPENGGDDPPLPYEVEADRIVLEGERVFRAIGTVEIRREDLRAFADSAVYDQVEEMFTLDRNARIDSDTYNLSARTIRLHVPEDELRDVFAVGDAVMTGEDLTLTAPEIRIFLAEGRMQRLVAVRDVAEGESAAAPTAATTARAVGRGDLPDRPAARGEPLDRTLPQGATEAGGSADEAEMTASAATSRPRAVTEDFVLQADSLEVLAPDEALELVFAAGRARGEALSDDTMESDDLPEIARRDWIEGDTIIALFVPGSAGPTDMDPGAEGAEVPARDAEGERMPPEGPPAPDAEEAGESERYVLERLIARVDARSLYRLRPSGAESAQGNGRLAVHYVRGSQITILMKDGTVEDMEVEGPTRGLHLEPTRAATTPPATVEPVPVPPGEGR